MKNRITTIAAFAIASAAGLASSASGAVMTTFTADNHYCIYTDLGGVISRIGGNELGSGGSPGAYNWSLPESYTFDAGEHIYIAAWSDDAVAQGLIGEIDLGNGEIIRSGDARWEFMTTNVNLGDGSPWPEAEDVAGFVNLANLNDLWRTPFVYEANTSSTGPWGAIPGLSAADRWMWGNPNESSNPLIGGQNQTEYQIFRINAPTPGGAALALIGGFIALRRKR